MAYVVGIDVGTTSTSAATALIGDAARRRQVGPDLVVREFKRRSEDPVRRGVPGRRPSPPEITASVARWVTDRVAERQGGRASAVAVTHPGRWGAEERRRFSLAIAERELPDALILSAPVATAASYGADQAQSRIGATIAVYDLGGGTFEAAVVRRVGERSFELIGVPQGVDGLGGLEFDQVVFKHLHTNGSIPPIGARDAHPATMFRLRRACVEAKEALSTHDEVTFPVLLAERRHEVSLRRGEFEDLIRGAVEQTVDVLRATVEAAGVVLDDIDAVLLVGGSSSIPLVTQLVSQRIGRPVVMSANPKGATAVGAAVLAAHAKGAVPRVGAPTATADAHQPRHQRRTWTIAAAPPPEGLQPGAAERAGGSQRRGRRPLSIEPRDRPRTGQPPAETPTPDPHANAPVPGGAVVADAGADAPG